MALELGSLCMLSVLAVQGWDGKDNWQIEDWSIYGKIGNRITAIGIT